MSALPQNEHQYIVKKGERTHIILPIEEYRRLTGGAESGAGSLIADAERKIADPDAEWMTTEELASALAWNRIALARRAKGLSQHALADMAGLNQTRVSRIERDPKKANVEDLRRIAEALDLDLGALVRGITEQR